MRSAVRVVLAAPILAVLVATSSTAQSLTPCVHQIIFSTEREIFVATRGDVRPAYTATVKQTYEQKLADGNTIHWTIEAIQARDEAGRTMRQHVQGCDADAGGSPLRIVTSINDPASRTAMNWNTGPGSRAITTIFHQAEPSAPQAPPDLKDAPLTPSTQYKPQLTREDLGTRTIAGMEATGTRVTETIPAGFLGNDMPLKAVHETWVDSKTHAILMAIDDDPRNLGGGRRTWEVESLIIGPPDPALFTPPAGYRVWDPRPQTTAVAKP